MKITEKFANELISSLPYATALAEAAGSFYEYNKLTIDNWKDCGYIEETEEDILRKKIACEVHEAPLKSFISIDSFNDCLKLIKILDDKVGNL
jgi:hypothetical protein